MAPSVWTGGRPGPLGVSSLHVGSWNPPVLSCGHCSGPGASSCFQGTMVYPRRTTGFCSCCFCPRVTNSPILEFYQTSSGLETCKMKRDQLRHNGRVSWTTPLPGRTVPHRPPATPSYQQARTPGRARCPSCVPQSKRLHPTRSGSSSGKRTPSPLSDSGELVVTVAAMGRRQVGSRPTPCFLCAGHLLATLHIAYLPTTPIQGGGFSDYCSHFRG